MHCVFYQAIVGRSLDEDDDEVVDALHHGIEGGDLNFVFCFYSVLCFLFTALTIYKKRVKSPQAG